MSRTVPEEVSRTETRTEARDRRGRDRVRRAISAVHLTQPTSPIVEKARADNRITLAAGEFGGFTFDVPHTTLRAAATGAVVARAAVFGQHALVEGVEFLCSVPVVVKADARVVFIGCRFHKPAGAGQALLRMEAGAKALLSGCVFTSDVPLMGPIIIDTGTATDLYISGHNATGGVIGAYTNMGVI